MPVLTVLREVLLAACAAFAWAPRALVARRGRPGQAHPWAGTRPVGEARAARAAPAGAAHWVHGGRAGVCAASGAPAGRAGRVRASPGGGARAVRAYGARLHRRRPVS